MKSILTFTLILIGGFTFAQNEFALKYNEDSLIEYQGVVENAEAKKSDLFTKGVEWMSNRDKKYSITFQDEEVGKIEGNAEFTTIGKNLHMERLTIIHFLVY